MCDDQEAVDIAVKCETAQEASSKLLEYALSHNSKDNISIIVIKLGNSLRHGWLMVERQLDTYVKKKYFEREWEALEKKQETVTESRFSDALKEINRMKNRYINIIPCKFLPNFPINNKCPNLSHHSQTTRRVSLFLAMRMWTTLTPVGSK